METTQGNGIGTRLIGAGTSGSKSNSYSYREKHNRRRLPKTTPGSCPVSLGRQSCLELKLKARADDNHCHYHHHNHNQDSHSQDQESFPRPRIRAHPPSSKRQLKLQPHLQTHPQTHSQPPANMADDSDSDSISLYSIHSPITLQTFPPNDKHKNMETDLPFRRRSKTPVFFVGQLERKSGLCTLDRAVDKAQMLAAEYQAVLPLHLKTSFSNSSHHEQKPDHDDDLTSELELKSSSRYLLPRTPKRLRKIKCQPGLRDLVKQHSQRGPSSSPHSPWTPGSDAETLVGSPPCSPVDEDFEKPSPVDRSLFSNCRSSSNARHIHVHEREAEQSLPARDADMDIGMRICTELLTNELATALLSHRSTSTSPPASTKSTERASGLQVLLMIEAYEAVQQQVRRMLYHARVTGKQFSHVRDAEEILEHWLQALYGVYDLEQEEESKRNRAGYEWPLWTSTEVVRADR